MDYNEVWFSRSTFHEKAKKKSSIRETSNLSTEADSSTDATVGWTKNTQKRKKNWKTEKVIKNQKTQKRLEICQN